MKRATARTMRISWLDPAIIDKVRAVLMAWYADWDVHFSPGFRVPPAPPGIPAERWPRVAEHVARAERVAQTAREQGLAAAEERFGGSAHAVERATVLAAAMHCDAARFEHVVAVLQADIDDLVLYGPFLELLENLAGEHERARAFDVYERFCRAAMAFESHEPMWREWAGALPEALAGLYVRAGRLDEAHALFLERHDAQADDVLVALAASRAFLAAGQVDRATYWIEAAGERALALGRTSLAERLRAKAARLRARS